jgi:NFU1 iron-sulfur cluster scaffold homolog, mitochondrial
MGWFWESKKQKKSSNEEESIKISESKMIKESEISIDIMPTPNPNALKFLFSSPVKSEGSSTYLCKEDCKENKLASKLFDLRGIDHIHFFDNFITVTKFGYASWDELENEIMGSLNKNFPTHDPNYFDPDPEEERRRNLPPDLKAIEEILDRTVRPGLQGDGGDIQTLSLEDNVLMIKYQGACGTCPSASTGTLEAIKSILRDEFNPNLDVYIAPEMY